MAVKKSELYTSLWSSFDDLVKAKGRPDIGDRINKVIRKLADENNLVGIID